VKKYRAWIELVLCTKCAECCDKTEIKDHEFPFRILVTLFEGGQFLGRLKGPLSAEALKLISTIQHGFVGEGR
jgi:hypothetical protein